jgi:hypothetical protein
MIMKRNPIAITPLPIAGRQLDPNWKASTDDHGGTFDRRPLSEMWKNPQWASKLNADNVQNVIRGARLSSTPSGV